MCASTIGCSLLKFSKFSIMQLFLIVKLIILNLQIHMNLTIFCFPHSSKIRNCQLISDPSYTQSYHRVKRFKALIAIRNCQQTLSFCAFQLISKHLLSVKPPLFTLPIDIFFLLS